jgi:hypothetical protein
MVRRGRVLQIAALQVMVHAGSTRCRTFTHDEPFQGAHPLASCHVVPELLAAAPASSRLRPAGLEDRCHLSVHMHVWAPDRRVQNMLRHVSSETIACACKLG